MGFAVLFWTNTHLCILYLSLTESGPAVAKQNLAADSGLMMESNVVLGNYSQFTGAFDAAAWSVCARPSGGAELFQMPPHPTPVCRQRDPH